MFKATMLAGAVLMGIGLLASPVFAQGAPQIVTKVDVKSVQTAYRSSKVIGSTVYNEQNETVGKVDDLLISSDGNTPFAVLSVGGFLGMGERLIVVPTGILQVAFDKDKSDRNKIVFPGATKDALKTMPEYTYNTK